jgi:hypothetical protein
MISVIFDFRPRFWRAPEHDVEGNRRIRGVKRKEERLASQNRKSVLYIDPVA